MVSRSFILDLTIIDLSLLPIYQSLDPLTQSPLSLLPNPTNGTVFIISTDSDQGIERDQKTEYF